MLPLGTFPAFVLVSPAKVHLPTPWRSENLIHSLIRSLSAKLDNPDAVGHVQDFLVYYISL